MTPYLIMDNQLTGAMCFAAKRGVKVKLILPHIPDKKYAFALAKTHYKELAEAGVEIYEYTPGFVHAKVFLADDKEAVVGTINLDYRSLYLHFECAAYMYKVSALKDIKADYIRRMESSNKMLLKQGYISKDKIREKIEELKKVKGDFATYIATRERIAVLKELLKESETW